MNDRIHATLNALLASVGVGVRGHGGGSFMPFSNLAYATERREERHEVHHRTRAAAVDGPDIAIIVVNLSPNGLMARCEQAIDVGARLHVALPGIGLVHAEVRWSLGGRIGCEFQHSIPLPSYYGLLPKMI